MEDHILINYLKKQLASSAETEVENWINASAENKKYFEEFEKLWRETGNIPELASPDIDTAWNHLNNVISRHTIWNRYHYLFKAAAMVAVIFMAYVVFKSQLPSWKTEKFVTVISEDSIRKVILTDNTVIWLNKHSSLAYSDQYNYKQRQVKLEGEAFFEVHHDKHKPFVVNTQHTTIIDLGTSFNVNSETLTQSVKVAVVTGSVSFSADFVQNREVVLTPNQVGERLANQKIIIKTVNIINENAWITGKLVFRNQTFSEIATTIEAIYHSKITFKENEVSDLRITASFDHQSLDEVLSVLGATTNLKYKITGQKVIFYK